MIINPRRETGKTFIGSPPTTGGTSGGSSVVRVKVLRRRMERRKVENYRAIAISAVLFSFVYISFPFLLFTKNKNMVDPYSSDI